MRWSARTAPDLTVVENIFLGAEMTGIMRILDGARMQAQARTVLERLHFRQDMSVRVADLSRAEKQLVEVAGALERLPGD